MTRGYERSLSSTGVYFDWAYFQTGPSSLSDPIDFSCRLDIKSEDSWDIPIGYEISSSENINIHQFHNKTVKDGSIEDLPQVDKSLEQVSVETSWQLSLPSHITNRLSQVRTDRQTTFGDHSSLVRDLIIPLEQHLAIITEYHGHNYWGDQWAKEVEGNRPFAIGDYIQFFDTEASKQLEAYDIIQNKIDTAVVGSQPVTQLRNALNHGRDPGVTSNRDEVISEDQFEDIYADVTALMEALSYDTPVIGEVESTFGDSYRVQLHWENILKRTWISCDKELKEGEMYYLPQSGIGEQTQKVESGDIIPCEEERATSFLHDDS
ncbi:hypothetical protein SAMN04488067_102285 [Halorubrum xinjiangense]|uniref:Uncharacterized protein n=1 Tax=Halorubrum xinjiangense TaxID=261291 RepID=A0A1G7J3A1_9EURY|nr:hypothetical protein [Halorubrum xinjiangense]SDF19472.1 hypothetical protein SAMN04488067_102285 [Halorubrum xinjiangense]